MTIRRYTEADRERWDRYVARSSHATLYHTSAWRSILEETFGSRYHAWLAEDEGGDVRGILPVVHQRSFLFGNYAISLPHSSYGGVCADTAEHERALVEAAIEWARREGATSVLFRQRSPAACDLPYQDHKHSLHLDLGGGADALWRRFDARLRSQIRRPGKDGFNARMGGLEDLDRFYRVFSTNMRDLGTPVFPRTLFQHVLERFAGAARLCLVEREGAPAAAALLLGHGDTLEVPWASSLREHKRSAPNMLLYWTAIQFAAEHGYARLDMGRSTIDSGTYRFKLQWGATAKPQLWYYWRARPGHAPDLAPDNPRFSLAIACWRRLPLPVANALGPVLVKRLP